MADYLTPVSGHRAAKARAGRDFRALRWGVEIPDWAATGRPSVAGRLARTGWVATALLLTAAAQGWAQASGTLRAEARVIEAQAGQQVLAAARRVGGGPIPARADVGLATISVREVAPPPSRPPSPSPASSQPHAVVPTRIVSIQFLRN
jgi:hypothetical protein